MSWTCRYLRFLLGVIESNTLPLNVSHKMLQQLEAVKTIKKKLVRKALDMIKKLAESSTEQEDDEEGKDHQGRPRGWQRQVIISTGAKVL